MGAGNSQTYVRNEYHEKIYAKVNTERVEISDLKIEVDKMGSVEEKIHHITLKGGFVAILPNNYVRFEPDCSSANRVYITIIAKHGNVFCDNLAKKVGYSVKLRSDGQVVDVKDGSLWEEDN
ncbi:hypothetical protein ACF0H5_007643 [Mactra antiquata]